MTSNSDKASDSVRKIRLLLAEWLRCSKDSREPVASILEHLEIVDACIRAVGDGPGVDREKSVRNIGTTYTIEKDRNSDEVLMEHRAGGKSNPFRCPKYLYEATVTVLAGAEPAIDFEELMAAVAKLGFDPAEFQLRAALRFLLSRKPSLILRDRNRYRPVRKVKFEKEAVSAWVASAKQ